MKKIPFCKECKYYRVNGVCNHPKFGGKYPHINKDFWCCYGERKENTEKPLDLS